MATLILANPYIDFTSNPSHHWTVLSAASDRLVFHADNYQLVMEGQFTTDASGALTAGTVTAAMWNDGALTEAPSFRISGLSLDARALAMAVTAATGDQQVFSFLLSGNDTISGTSSNDYLQGFAGNDTVNAGAGNDHIFEGAGNDTIDGGAGLDVVSYAGKYADYVIERTSSAGSDGGYKVTNPIFSTDGQTPSPVDSLVNVERLYFSDKHVALVNFLGPGAQVFRLYQAAFGRGPDEAGFDYWTLQMDTKGVKLADIAYGFIVSDEFRKMYGSSTSNHDLVAKYYEHILHRAPDEGGLSFWTEVLDTHAASQSQVLAAISESQENVMASLTLIGNGIVMDPALMTI